MAETKDINHKLNEYLGWLYLGYLSLLPAMGTAGVLYLYGVGVGQLGMWLIFLGGVAAVGVYLATVGSYTVIPKQWWATAFLIADGPLIVLFFDGGGKGIWEHMVDAYLIDGTAVWLAILVLATQSPLPTADQRTGSIFFMFAALATTYLLFFPYINDKVLTNPWRLFGLIFGIAEASATRFYIFEKDRVLRDTDKTAVLIVVFIFVWLFALFGGFGYHQGEW
ncbi:MAG TPA: hypothetical protein VLL52_12120 [Anaerolineae bacterium]|nr:hypothetical protein [Anaerolineae bacterium]